MFSVGCLMCHTKKSRVVYYHDVHVGDSWTTMSTPFELFKLHISAIRKSGFEIVRDINNPKGEIQIAFDDGFRGLLDCVDWLVSQKIYPTIFIPISLIGKEGYLSESEILELHNAGFNIQSHGIRHKNMSAMPVDEFWMICMPLKLISRTSWISRLIVFATLKGIIRTGLFLNLKMQVIKNFIFQYREYTIWM